MTSEGTCSHMHLFTVRLWSEALGDGQYEWRGQVQHVLSGESRYFREWTVLVAYLQTMLATALSEGRIPHSGRGTEDDSHQQA